MDNLPTEILSDIIGYLPFHDRNAVRLTCRKFYDATLTQKFINRETFVITKTTIDTDSSTALNTLKTTNREYAKLEFHDVDFATNCFIWQRHGESVKTLRFYTCDISSSRFGEILDQCRNIETLHISYCRNLFMSGNVLTSDQTSPNLLQEKLKKLKDLQIIRCNYLSDAIFNRFMDLSPNLSALSLNSCQISFHTALHKRFYPDYYLTQTLKEPSKNVLTFIYILNFIKDRTSLIKSLDFGFTYIDLQSTESLLNLPGLELETLILNDCIQMSNRGFLRMAMANATTKLTHLNISRCSGVDDDVLIIVSNRMPNLKILDISHCERITNIGVEYLKRLKCLSDLNISCTSISGEALANGIFDEKNTTLTKLFARSINMSESTLIKIVNNAVELTHLNLSHCPAVNDDTCLEIFVNLKKLLSLKLSACGKITDSGLTGLIVHDGKQETAAIFDAVNGHCSNKISLKTKAEMEIINDANRKKWIAEQYENLSVVRPSFSLNCLSGLQQLELSECHRISDISLQYAFCFIDLKILKLSSCQQITNAGMVHLVQNASGIVDFDISHCYNITDRGILTIAKGLKRLENLSIRGNKHLTNCALQAIMDNCKTLFVLDVRGCSGMTNTFLQGIMQMDSIKSVNGCLDPHFSSDLVPHPPIPIPPVFRLL